MFFRFLYDRICPETIRSTSGKMRITAIGCGNGAFATALDLSSQGHEVTLYADASHEHNFEVIRETVYDCIQGSTDVFLPIEGPNSLDGRYLVEDAPYALVAMSEFGRIAGVKTPLMDAVVTMTSALRAEDYAETGRTAERMGIDGMDREELQRYLMTGERP